MYLSIDDIAVNSVARQPVSQTSAGKCEWAMVTSTGASLTCSRHLRRGCVREVVAFAADTEAHSITEIVVVRLAGTPSARFAHQDSRPLDLNG